GKNTYQIKTVSRKSNIGGTKPQIICNPKYREKAAKIVQGWWRDKKEKLQKMLDKIILIQSTWRGKWLRKYIYDIFYWTFLNQRYFDIIKKVLIGHVRPIVWEELFAQSKWAKDRISRILIEKDHRFTYLRIRPYFEKWKAVNDLLKKRNWRSKNWVDKRELDEQKWTDLQKYFDTWRLRANLAKYMSKSKNQEEQKKKFFATLDLINGAQKLAKRKGLRTTKPKLEDYLALQMRDKAIKKWLLHRAPKNSAIMLRKYFNKWKDITAKILLKEFKNSIFNNMCNRLDSRMDKLNLRQFFNIWRSKWPKDTYTQYSRGCDKLKNFTLRRNHKDPVEALKKKVIYESEKEGIMRMLGIKSRQIKYHWREYFYRWRSQAQKLKDKEIQNNWYKTLLNTMFNKRKNRILNNRFNQWRKTPKIDLDELFNRYKDMVDMINKTVNHCLKPTKKEFLDRTAKTTHPNALKKPCQKLWERYWLGDRNKLRHYFYKWRDQLNNLKWYDLKKQVLKVLLSANDNNNRKSQLAKAMAKWKWFNWIGKNDENSIRLRNIYLGWDKLQTLYIGREVEILIRLNRLLNIDHRPKFLKNLINRLEKPRTTLRDCFNKWRRYNDLENANQASKLYKSNMLKSKGRRIDDRKNRDDILKAYFKWKNLCRNPDDYYPKIAKGLNQWDHTWKNNQLTEPFNKLKGAKNYARRLIPLLKSNENLQKRLNKDLLKDKFNKWKDMIYKEHISDLKTNIVFKTKNNWWTNEKTKWLTKYFQRWKLFRPKSLNSDFYKGLMLVQNYCERPFVKPIANAFK
ncbi:MAG: hypothetical protein ACRC42_01935, partial [Mycoplasma sp.]